MQVERRVRLVAASQTWRKVRNEVLQQCYAMHPTQLQMRHAGASMSAILEAVLNDLRQQSKEMEQDRCPSQRSPPRNMHAYRDP